MKITLSLIQSRNEELNRRLDLAIGATCSKAPPTFTQRYILQTRSSTAKRSFERLIEAGVIVLCGKNSLGSTYRFNPKAYEDLKHATNRRDKEEKEARA